MSDTRIDRHRCNPDLANCSASDASERPTADARPPISVEECAELPTTDLDDRAETLRARLGRTVEYAGRDGDATELSRIEDELSSRAKKEKDAAARQAGVQICMRLADFPAKSVTGLQHWWLVTPNKEAGMGQPDGRVPGHGESGPSGLRTLMVDHSQEAKTDCIPVGVEAECVERKLNVGDDTGLWIPGFNDCHTLVNRIVDDCKDEHLDKLLEERHAKEVDGGAP